MTFRSSFVALAVSLGLVSSHVACSGSAPVRAVDNGGSSGGAADAATGDGGALDGDAPVALLDDAIAITAGGEHTCALRADQRVVCWGSNANGQLGVPAATGRSSVPLPVELPAKVTAVSAGARHTCALLATGKVACWGANLDAQLGRLPLVDANATPAEVTTPTEAPTAWGAVTGLAAGGSHTLALVSAGTIQGKNAFYVWGWGKNVFRQLVRDTNGFATHTPVLATANGAPPSGSNPLVLPVLRLGVGDDFACSHALVPVPSGVFFERVICFGANGKGQTGTPLAPQDPLASPLFAKDNTPLGLPRLVSAGAQHACAVAARQGGGEALYCWGDPTNGQTGFGNTAPADPAKADIVAGASADNITVLAAGGNGTCIVESGKVRCIGANDESQLGLPTPDMAKHPTWNDVPLPGVSALAVGRKHACAILGSAPGTPGRVSCWGLNRAGQLGDGLNLDVGYGGGVFSRGTPVAVRAPK